MKTAPIDSIVISPSRQRKNFSIEKQQEFSEKIHERGLLHAIVVRLEGKTLHLVAGERRIRAIANLYSLGLSITHDGEAVPSGHIPYTLLSDLDPISAEEAELEENICREDLTWQERAAALARIFELRERIAAAKGLPPPTREEVVEEALGEATPMRIGRARQELIVAKHLDNPAVASASTLKDAFKILKREEAAQRATNLGDLVGRTFSASLHRCYLADSLDWLAGAESESVDVILTDPPYGMGADEFGDSDGIGGVLGAHDYADDAEYYQKILGVCVEHFARIAKSQAHLYWFCDIENFDMTRQAFTISGWSVFRTPFIWYKRHGARAPWPTMGPQRKWEMLLYAVKGKMPVTKMVGDVLDYGPDAQLDHSAQKPVGLFRDLLSRSVLPGYTVLDPFCGTGTIFPAAHEMKCKAIGVERDSAHYGKAVKRIQGLK